MLLINDGKEVGYGFGWRISIFNDLKKVANAEV
jgi:hypothetical protein